MSSVFTRVLMVAGGLLAVFLAFSPWMRPAADAQGAPQPPAPQAGADADRVARGAYLVTLGGCNDCHTPWQQDARTGLPSPDMSRMLSGHPAGAPEPPEANGPNAGVFNVTMTAFRMPFGVVYAPNLTPEPDTGLGAWTEAQFVQAMRTGRHQGAADGRPILPPMPWPNLGSATDDDLAAMFAFLRTLPPVKNQVPAPKVPGEVLAKMQGAAAHAGGP